MRTKLNSRCAFNLNRGTVRTKICIGFRTKLNPSSSFTEFGDFRLLEDGFRRLLEDGDFRLLQ